MAGRVAELRKGARITDHISLGVVAKTVPVERVNAVLKATGKQIPMTKAPKSKPAGLPDGLIAEKCLGFGPWNFEFVWDLGFGIWKFPAEPKPGRGNLLGLEGG